jgi:hypothetical protein
MTNDTPLRIAEQLKPCPFCGSAAFYNEYVDEGRRWRLVTCQSLHCGVQLEMTRDEWNRRAALETSKEPSEPCRVCAKAVCIDHCPECGAPCDTEPSSIGSANDRLLFYYRPPAALGAESREGRKPMCECGHDKDCHDTRPGKGDCCGSVDNCSCERFNEQLRAAPPSAPSPAGGEPSEEAIRAAGTAMLQQMREGDGWRNEVIAALRAAYAIDGLRASSPALSAYVTDKEVDDMRAIARRLDAMGDPYCWHRAVENLLRERSAPSPTGEPIA